MNQKKYDNFEKIYEFISKLISKKRIELKYENGKFNLIIQRFLDDELIQSKIALYKKVINDEEDEEGIGLLNDKVKNEEKIQTLEIIIKKLEENNIVYMQKINDLQNKIEELNNKVKKMKK